MKLNARAILTGFAVDLFGSFYFQYLAFQALALIYGAVLAQRGYTNPQVTDKMLLGTPIFDGVMLAVGMIMTFMGGWTTAGRTDEARVLHAALGGLLVIPASTLLNMALTAGAPATPSTEPLWFDIFCYTVQVPLAAFGGWARQRDQIQKARDAKKDGPPISWPF